MKRTASLDNTPRFPSARGGHVESYFLRVNHPSQRAALWLKATVFMPSSRSGTAEAELWCIAFLPDQQPVAQRTSFPLALCRFDGEPLLVELGDSRFVFGPTGSAQGHVGSQGYVGSQLAWDLSWRAEEGPLGRPLGLFPFEWMVNRGFPRSKLLTPYPLLEVSGRLRVADRELELDRWLGAQGHNWGREHAWEYAWGQCVFTDDDGQPSCSVEGFSSRVKIARIATPRMSAMVVRRGDQSYRFDRLFDPWRQQAELDDLSWRVQLQGPGGEALLVMQAQPEEVACLGYRNPSGDLSYCLNSKVAQATLRVNPTNDEGFECSSHSAALEFLRHGRDSRFEVI